MKIEKIILDSYNVLVWTEELQIIYDALLHYEKSHPWSVDDVTITKIKLQSKLYLLQRMTTELKIVLTPEA